MQAYIIYTESKEKKNNTHTYLNFSYKQEHMCQPPNSGTAVNFRFVRASAQQHE